MLSLKWLCKFSRLWSWWYPRFIIYIFKITSTRKINWSFEVGVFDVRLYYYRQTCQRYTLSNVIWYKDSQHLWKLKWCSQSFKFMLITLYVSPHYVCYSWGVHFIHWCMSRGFSIKLKFICFKRCILQVRKRRKQWSELLHVGKVL